MDSGDVIQLIMLLILIGFSAIFSSAETALMTCNRIRLRSMDNEGNKKAGNVLDMVENSTDKMLRAILIGINVVNLYASSLATVLATRLFAHS